METITIVPPYEMTAEQRAAYEAGRRDAAKGINRMRQEAEAKAAADTSFASAFDRAFDNLQQAAGLLRAQPVCLSMPLDEARQMLRLALQKVLGEARAEWLPEYEKVARWLSGNGGRGLVLSGACGRGKSVLGAKVLPVLVHLATHKVMHCFTAHDLNRRPREVLSHHLLYVDDVGVEPELNDYGTKRRVFSEVCDEMERRGRLLVFSTNLTPQELVATYGKRTVERIVGGCQVVTFEGRSLRG